MRKAFIITLLAPMAIAQSCTKHELMKANGGYDTITLGNVSAYYGGKGLIVSNEDTITDDERKFWAKIIYQQRDEIERLNRIITLLVETKCSYKTAPEKPAPQSPTGRSLRK